MLVPMFVVVFVVVVHLRGLCDFTRNSQGHVFTEGFIFKTRERAVSAPLLTVSNLNGLFNIRESEEGVRQAKVIHKTATSVIYEEVIFVSI